MRTLFVSYSPLLGGAERILLDVAAAAPEPPLLASPPGPLAAAWPFEHLPLTPRPLELRASLRDRLLAGPRLAGAARELRDHVRRSRPELVVGWSMRGALAAAAARPPARLVFQHNDLLPSAAVGRLVKLAARRAELTIALSKAIAADLGEHAAVVHPGVDLARFAPAPPGRGALTLGALVAWKRPELAVAIAERAGVPLTLAGAPLDRDGEALGERLRERATLLGQADPRAALRDAACLLHAADREPFGLALVEALASGRPVVAPAAAGPLEIVDESCGRLYPPGDVDAGAAALRDALENAEALGRAGRERAERCFDVREASARWWAAATSAGAGP